MGKVSKLVKSPGAFFRDYLIKRYPIDINQRIPQGGFSAGNKSVERWDDLGVRSIVFSDLDCSFPVDFVFTYVDQSDPAFAKEVSAHLESAVGRREVTDAARFCSHEELKYALRSVEKFSPWVRKVHVVTNGQVPSWLNTSCEKLNLVFHDQIIDKKYLPTFNSHVIESCLHRIDGLAEHYVYFNDDMMLSRNVRPEYFFSPAGLAFIFLSDVKLPNAPVNDWYDTATEWGGKNGRRLIHERYGVSLDGMLSHTHYPQVKSVSELCEAQWQKEFDLMRANRFRAPTDLLATGYLFPHVAVLEGQALYTRARVAYFNVRMRGALKHYHWLMSVRGTDRAPFSICPNDRYSGDGERFPQYHESLIEFLEAYYPDRSIYEV